MGQFYARVFVQILDSSIAEDFMVRHVFEDMLKVCDMNGVVDMTRTSMSRRFNVPLEELNRCIEKLEAPDPHSRDGELEGRRLLRLDEHRDWGWRILNWAKYEAMRTKADVAIRVGRYREKEKEAEEKPGVIRGVRATNRPKTVADVIEYGRMVGVTDPMAEKFWNHYESIAKQDENGMPVWVTGKDGTKVVGDWKKLLVFWRTGNQERAAMERSRPKREAQREPGPAITCQVMDGSTGKTGPMTIGFTPGGAQ